MKKIEFLSAALLLCFSNPPIPLSAQETANVSLPDPATIEVPDVSPSSDPRVEKQGHKFFYFNNPDATFQQAYSDLAECRQHLPSGAVLTTPRFIPWIEPLNRPAVRGFNPEYGLVGAVIGPILLNHLERGYRANKMRICMKPRGYKRYAIPELAWQKLNEADETQILFMQAKIASAPKPVSGEVAE